MNAGWLAWGLYRRGDFTLSVGWIAFAGRVVLATSAMGAGLEWCGRTVDWLGLGNNEAVRASAMAAAIMEQRRLGLARNELAGRFETGLYLDYTLSSLTEVWLAYAAGVIQGADYDEAEKVLDELEVMRRAMP